MSANNNEHVIEVLCEIRFSGIPALPAGAILPGLLFGGLQGEGLVSTIVALPQAQVPLEMREKDENLKYLTTHRMMGPHGFIVAAGDHSVSVSISREYDGWAKLRDKARAVFNRTIDTQVLGTIERVSVKYVNLFQAELGADHFQMINASLRIGSRTLTSEGAYLRYEIKEADFASVIQIYGQGKLKSSVEAYQATGLILDMDFVAMRPHSPTIDDVMSSLDAAHERAVVTYRDIKGDR